MNDNMGSNEENKKYSEPGRYKQAFITRKNENTCNFRGRRGETENLSTTQKNSSHYDQ